MGLGIKRTCLACAAKFYDLEKDPIICPKCSKKFDVEDFNKPKRGRKKAVEEVVEDIELEDDDAIELLDEDAEDIADDDVVIADDDLGLEDDESIEEIEGDPDRLLVEIEEDNDDIIESDDGRD